MASWCRSGGSSSRRPDRKSTRLNSSHSQISYAVFCLKKKKSKIHLAKLNITVTCVNSDQTDHLGHVDIGTDSRTSQVAIALAVVYRLLHVLAQYTRTH